MSTPAENLCRTCSHSVNKQPDESTEPCFSCAKDPGEGMYDPATELIQAEQEGPIIGVLRKLADAAAEIQTSHFTAAAHARADKPTTGAAVAYSIETRALCMLDFGVLVNRVIEQLRQEQGL